MKKRITFFILYFLFWYFLFVLARVAFLLVYFGKTMQLTVFEIIDTFTHGLKLDLAISAYLVAIPSLALVVSCFFSGKSIKYFYHIYSLIASFASITIILGDLFLYKYWGFRMDATPLFYMANPKAAIASVSTLTVIGGLLSTLAITGLIYWVYLKIFSHRLLKLQKSPKAAVVLLPATLLLFLIMRGGIGIASLTTSTAYFSQKQFANHAAINPIWNLAFSLSESSDLKRKFIYYGDNEVNRLVSGFNKADETSIALLRIKRPNIILVITESLTAKVVAATGGMPEITPELNKLVKEGIVFDNLFAASDRTDRGLSALLAGYPSLPGTSPLKFQKLTEKLAYIPKKLNANGYRSEFYYGGTLEFANYRSFLIQAGFGKMVSDKDFPSEDLQTKWGAFDHKVFNRVLAETPDSDSLFFKTILTLTSHEPYKIPVPPVFEGNGDEIKFLNSLHYTDQSLGDFIKMAKKRKWWENTLIIIIADHGCQMPGNSGTWDAATYHIPMIWLGGALKVHDTVINTLSSQTDLAATLMKQLEINHADFIFSKNILAKEVNPFAFFTFSEGFGYLIPGDLSLFNTLTNTYIKPALPGNKASEKQAKAYLQYLYEDAFNKNSKVNDH